MLKDDRPKTQHQQLEEDLQFMLSSIRARQNTLIFYLEKLKNSLSKNTTELKLAKNQFQQKDKIYSRQVGNILQKHSDYSSGNLQQNIRYHSSVRAFWIKLKTILKVSIQRILSFNVIYTDKLHQFYEKALATVQRNSESQKSLIAYREVENFFKKRTIEALLLGKQALSPSISYSESKMQKNRSQTLFKPETAISRFTVDSQDTQFFEKRQTYTLISKQKAPKQQYLYGLADIKEQNNQNSQPKIKSLNRIKNRRPDETIKANIMNFIKVQRLGKLKSTSKASQKYIKKINKHVQRYEKNFDGAFDGKYEVSTLLDKKKTIFENIYLLYDDLFAKNIPNHKMISKFMFNTTKINQILYNAYEKKRKMNLKKEKNKQKDQSNLEGKEKDSTNPHKKTYKQKEKDQAQDKERNPQSKHTKFNRKYHLAKQHHHHMEVFTINTKEKQHYREKKESQTTAITSKHQTNYKQIHHEKHQKDKQKKILRSKTAKIKLNSEIHNPNTFVLNQNFLNGKHFISHHTAQKSSQKGGNPQKIVKTIGV